MLVTLGNIKATTGPLYTYMGIQGEVPSIQNGAKLPVRLGALKAAIWPLLLRRYLSAGEISRANLDELIGCLPFAQSAILGRFARADGPHVPEVLHRPIPRFHRRRRDYRPQTTAPHPRRFYDSPRELWRQESRLYHIF